MDKTNILGHIFSGLFSCLTEKCELNWKYLILSKNVLFLKYSESKPFATFKLPLATCGEWRMGWTTLVYDDDAVSLV